MAAVTKFVLGPSIDNVVEPDPVPPPPPPARVSVILATPATGPGGNVYLAIDESAIGIRPINIYAYFVPIEAKPIGDALVVGTFFKSSWLNAMISVPDTGPLASPGCITVTGVTPGIWFVQTILEYTV